MNFHTVCSSCCGLGIALMTDTMNIQDTGGLPVYLGAPTRRILLDVGHDISLARYLWANAQAWPSVVLNGDLIVVVEHGILVVSGENVYFRWPENFRLELNDGVHLLVDEIPEPGGQWKARWEYTEYSAKHLEHLFVDAHKRILTGEPATTRKVFLIRK